VRKPIRIDKDELEKLAKVKFSWSDIAELVGRTTDYRERFQGPPLPDFMLVDATRSSPTTELEARRAFVEAVEGVWHERSRKRGPGSSYQSIIRKRVFVKQIHEGPLLRLLLTLFQAMGEAESPSPATLHHDLNFLRTSCERNRYRKQTRGT
jgi:hypothetical protein